MRASYLGLILAVLLAAAPAPGAEPGYLVALVVDTSGSVGAPELDRARALVDDLLDGLPKGSEIAIFRFDDQVRLVQPRTARRDEVKGALSRLASSGRHTALYDALYDATKYVREGPGGRGALVLITDGLDEDSALKLEDGLRVAEEARVPVFTIGVGKAQEQGLRRIAKLTGGEYAPIARARGAAIAGHIAARAAAAVPTAVAPAAEPPRPSPAPAVTATPAAPPTTTAAHAPEPPRRIWPWLALAALAVGGALLAVMASRRGREARCPTCRRPLDHPFATCRACFPEDEPFPSRRHADHTLQPELSATVLTKVGAAEESAEKTIVLRDRPMLTVTTGKEAGRVYDLRRDGSTSLGRARANDIVIDDVACSNEHCRVRPEEGRFVLHDLQSTNGTFVNERRVSSQTLEAGDVVQVGETHLTFWREQTR
ncbi:MAG: FHA domain-containing protein [Vicinamibacteria bacterium]